MKTKLEMAHEFMLAMIKAGCHDGPDLLGRAWLYADAMQAEADKRGEEEIDRWSDELSNILKLSKFKPLELQPDSKEWQPDWSQAPTGYDWFVVGGRSGKGFFCLVEPSIIKDHYWFVGEDSISIDKHDYTGDWRDSLRKRPN